MLIIANDTYRILPLKTFQTGILWIKSTYFLELIEAYAHFI